jgi:daunorubicin resistance ABC transporter ATP-binding subunit
MTPAVLVEGLTKTYRGGRRALAGVDFEVPAGSVLALLGPNGAGKTTVVRILATLLRPDGGRAVVAGADVVRQASLVRQRIGICAQNAALDQQLTARENLLMLGQLVGLSRAGATARSAELLDRLRLGEFADELVKRLSGGTVRRLDVAASLLGNPPVLFLDEPTTGLDPRARQDVWDNVSELVTAGTTVLLTTQYLEEADRLADAVVVIDHGRVIAEGTPAELKRRAGSASLQVVVDQPARAAGELQQLGQVTVDATTVVVRLAAGTNGADVVAEAARRMSVAGIVVVELALSQPSLDDVFLGLIGDDVPVVVA